MDARTAAASRGPLPGRVTVAAVRHITDSGTVVDLDFLRDLADDARLLLSERGLDVPAESPVESLVYNYLNWTRRRVEPRARRVLWSKRLSLTRTKLPKAVRVGLNALASKAEDGVDLTPHLSDRILKPGYRDLLLYDWGIHHFHLDLPTGSPRKPGFVNGANEILFGIVGADFIGFLDIGTHGSFTDRVLLEVIVQSWPEVLDPYEIRGLPPPRFPQPDVTAVAREKHFNTVMALSNGRSYAPPGGGMASDGSSATVRRHVDDVLARAIELQERVVREADDIRDQILKDQEIGLATLRPILRWNGREFAIEEPQAKCRMKFTDP